jgi:hypothetical protein
MYVPLCCVRSDKFRRGVRSPRTTVTFQPRSGVVAGLLTRICLLGVSDRVEMK